MGGLASTLWGFYYKEKEDLDGVVDGVIEGNETLKWAKDEAKPYYEEAKDIKKEWQFIEESQRGADGRGKKQDGLDGVI